MNAAAARRLAEAKLVWGMTSAIDIYGCDPARIRDPDLIRRFVVELCTLTGMKRHGETLVEQLGDEARVAGYAMVQLIDTALISARFANLTNAVYLDVSSCKPYDAEAVRSFAERYFGGCRSVLHIHLRR